MQRVTDEPGQVWGAALRAQVTGPAVELVGDPATEEVVVRFTWPVENVGTGAGRAGLRVNLQIDAAFGDFSQLIMETDQSLAGALRFHVVDLVAVTPVGIPAGGSRNLFAELHIPVSAMLDRQGSVAGFNWWIVELTAWDEVTGAMLKRPDGSDARYEIRDWFKVTRAAPHGLKGDLDNDGRVSKQDLAMLRDWVGGYIDETWLANTWPDWSPGDEDEILWRADMNDDGRVNALDLTALEMLIAGG